MPASYWREQISLVMRAQGANALRSDRAMQRRAASATSPGSAELLGDSPGDRGRGGCDRASILLVDTNPCADPPADSLDPTTDTIEDRCERYAKLRKQTLTVAEYIADIDTTSPQALGRDTQHIADNLNRCGSYLVFRRYDVIAENRLQAGMFCQCGRLCAFCSMRRMVRAVQRFVPLVYDAIKEHDAIAAMWTPTVQNGPDLLDRIDLLLTSAKKLHQRGKDYRCYLASKKRRAQRFTEWHKVIGELWACEIKKGSGSGLWHPHTHSIILCTELPDAAALSDEWRELTNGSHRVDVRELHAMQAIRDGATCDEVRDQLTKDLLEVISYSLKFSSMNPAETWEAFLACSGRNLMGRRGVLYGRDVPDEYLDAPIDVDDLPWVETVARWYGDRYHIQHADDWSNQ